MIDIVYILILDTYIVVLRASEELPKNLCITNLVQLLPGLGKEPFEVQRKVMNVIYISFEFLVIHPTH